MTGETPSPLDVLRRCITTGRWSAFMEDNEPERQAGLAALAQVQTLAEAAQKLAGTYLGTEHGVHVDSLAFIELGAALVPFPTHQNTDEPSDGRGLSGSRLP